MGDVEKLIADLSRPMMNEDVMQRWDYIRRLIAEGHKGSHPRDVFESDLDAWDQERTEAARALTALQAENSEMKAAFDAQERDASLADGNLWRFWSRKAREVAKENERLREALQMAEAFIIQGDAP